MANEVKNDRKSGPKKNAEKTQVTEKEQKEQTTEKRIERLPSGLVIVYN